MIMSSKVVRSASLAGPQSARAPHCYRGLSPTSPAPPPTPPTSVGSKSSRVAALPMATATSTLGRHPEHNLSSSSLDFTADELATQLTLLDLPVFRSIQPDELASCSWNKKNKLEVAPNVVSFIRRFNHVSFWTVQEVLSRDSPKRRADVVAHFVKLARRLHDLNNLHAEFAVLSALQSAALFRLSRTWQALGRKDRQQFDKLCDLFSERDNFARLREHMGATALGHQDCIPYLGLYLTDLIYVDMAHPHSGGLESQQRQFKMNNILRIVSELQRSEYHMLEEASPQCRAYLGSIRYIDELQKFIEEDNYKLSLKLEPPQNSSSAAAPPGGPSSSSSRESVISGSAKNAGKDPNAMMAELNLSPAKGVGRSSVRGASSATAAHRASRKAAAAAAGQDKAPFVPGHRKCRSDGANIFLSCSGGGSKSGGGGYGCADDLSSWASGTLSSGTTSEECFRQHNLIDDSLVEDPFGSFGGGGTASEDSGSARSGSLDKRKAATSSSSSARSPLSEMLPPPLPEASATTTTSSLPTGSALCTFEGCVKRKTLIKDGRRPTMSGGWQRYWLQMWGSSVVYFPPRTLVTKGMERRDFRSEPTKCHSVEGWVVMVPQDGEDLLSFQLTDPQRRSVYRFRAPTPDLAAVWVRCLLDGAAGVGGQARAQRRQPPANLISFE